MCFNGGSFLLLSGTLTIRPLYPPPPALTHPPGPQKGVFIGGGGYMVPFASWLAVCVAYQLQQRPRKYTG